MPDVLFTFNLDIDPWSDLDSKTPDGLVSRVGLLPDGTESGRPVVALVTTMEDGSEIVSQITWSQFKQIYEAMAMSPVIALDSLS